ncbi:uncharacterized protein LOC128864188 [Anastrepha ludens]|uniref:uncharacterized protein LOC128864188 n=1 Tax=Anastrepha ludens TaxID=28586 RepID=UPI0023AFB1F9|nr:uncharacterized protein LOC128864188 [Anastrepha ludens]
MVCRTSKLANFSQSVLRNLPLNPTQLKRYVADKCCPSGTSQTAEPNSSSPLKNDAFTPPDFLPVTAYKALSDPKEVLGPGAHKCKAYKNPEYYAYHRFSFYELQRATLDNAKCAEGGVLYAAERVEDDCLEGDSAGAGAPKDAAKEAKECKENNEEMQMSKDNTGGEKRAADDTAKKNDENCEN